MSYFKEPPNKIKKLIEPTVKTKKDSKSDIFFPNLKNKIHILKNLSLEK